MSSISPTEFAAKWTGSSQKERSTAQEHFIDICRMLGAQTPNEADPRGDWYAFEKGATKTDGSDGFADVWKRKHFAWEYKGKHKSLEAAYKQLLDYREDLENPPILVVCDLDRFEIHTNYTNTVKDVHKFTLRDLARDPAKPLKLLKAVLTDPEALRPGQTAAYVTEEAARRFAELAGGLQSRGHDPLKAAHFLNRLLFCLFAEDIGLLPSALFTRLLEGLRRDPEAFDRQLRQLFGLMSAAGGHFGVDSVHWFNGGLFDDDETLRLTESELDHLAGAARLDWSSVEPSILGTLFERGLDPEKRGQLGAHYTDRASIERIIEPVLIAPLQAEFELTKQDVLAIAARERAKRSAPRSSRRATRRPEVERFKAFLARLRNVRVLDPACGSGNFLYVALRRLKDLEYQVLLWGTEHLGIPLETPAVGPENVLGLELSPYATELARTSIWIGQIQWMIEHASSYATDPVLRTIDTVKCTDAVLDCSQGDGQVNRPTWPEAEFIVGNPPFIGGKLMRSKLGDRYVDDLFHAWQDLVPREADFVCYWHEAARQAIERSRTRRAGLLATQGIRGGANQEVLRRILDSGGIFEAWQDEDWVVDGAAVRISIVCQDDGSQSQKRLDGRAVARIHADLTGGHDRSADLTTALRLRENQNVAFMGDTKGGAFDISRERALAMLGAVGNPNGRPNSEVVLPWVNSLDVVRRPRGMFIVDFGTDSSKQAAMQFEQPFAHLQQHVEPIRRDNKRATYAERWWIHVEPRPAMRAALKPLARFIVTPTVAKHRIFAWLRAPVLPDHQLIVIARDDDFAFGVLSSRAHGLWSLRKGTQLEDRPRYTPTTTFETFPFPWPLSRAVGQLTQSQLQAHARISAAAITLEAARSRWLNPEDLVRWEDDEFDHLPARSIPRSAPAASVLQKRTLTALYNASPAWLEALHQDLDAAVSEAYGWPSSISDEVLLSELLALNQLRHRETPLLGELT